MRTERVEPQFTLVNDFSAGRPVNRLYPEVSGFPELSNGIPSGIPCEIEDYDRISPSLRNRTRPFPVQYEPTPFVGDQYYPSAPPLNQLVINPPTVVHNFNSAENDPSSQPAPRTIQRDRSPPRSCWRAPDGIGPMAKPRCRPLPASHSATNPHTHPSMRHLPAQVLPEHPLPPPAPPRLDRVGRPRLARHILRLPRQLQRPPPHGLPPAPHPREGGGAGARSAMAADARRTPPVRRQRAILPAGARAEWTLPSSRARARARADSAP